MTRDQIIQAVFAASIIITMVVPGVCLYVGYRQGYRNGASDGKIEARQKWREETFLTPDGKYLFRIQISSQGETMVNGTGFELMMNSPARNPMHDLKPHRNDDED